MRILAVALPVLLTLCAPAAAENAIDIQSSPAQILETHASVERAISRNEGVFKDMGAAEKKAILDQHAIVAQILRDKESIAALNGLQQVQLANSLESIDALMTKAEDDRKVCERVKVIGSNRPQNVCMTVGMRKRLRQDVEREGIRAER